MEKNLWKFHLLFSLTKKSSIAKIDTCHNNPEKSSTIKVNKYDASGYSLLTHGSFDSNKNKHDYYRGKDCMKNFWKNLGENIMKITNFERLKMLPLTEKENKHKQKTFLCI